MTCEEYQKLLATYLKVFVPVRTLVSNWLLFIECNYHEAGYKIMMACIQHCKALLHCTNVNLSLSVHEITMKLAVNWTSRYLRRDWCWTNWSEVTWRSHSTTQWLRLPIFSGSSMSQAVLGNERFSIIISSIFHFIINLVPCRIEHFSCTQRLGQHMVKLQ